jgi:hypothetical protein
MTMMNLVAHRLHAALITILLISATAQLSSAQVHNADCSYLIAGRTFAQLFEGYINLGPDAGVLPNAGGGVLTFQPHGKVTGTLDLTVGLFIYPKNGRVPQDGTYHVVWDTGKEPTVCTGTAAITSTLTGTDHFQLVVSSDGERVEMIHTDLGLTLDFTLTPMHTGRCDNNTLRSVYSYSAKGWIAPPPFPPDNNLGQLLNPFIPFAFSGAISFDPHRPAPSEPPGAPPGSAYLQGWDTVSLNGSVVPVLRTYTGWYKVNRDCTSTGAFVDNLGNPATHTEVFIGKEGTSIAVVNVDPGVVLAFSATSAGDHKE